MLGAVVFGHEQMQTVIQAIEELVEAGGKAEVGMDGPREEHRPHRPCARSGGRCHA